MDLHLQNDINGILIGDKKLRDEPEVISVLVESHRGPFVV